MDTVLALFLVLLIVCPPAQAAFSFRRQITVNHTQVPNTDQANFPVGVIETLATLATVGNGGHVQNGSGFDVGFYTNTNCSTGKMTWETDTYTASNGAIVYWVKNVTLSHTADTIFYMCYGDATITTDQSNKTGVWDANYLGVWHFGESGAPYHDSTINANNFPSGTNPTQGTGMIGKGQVFSSASGTNLNIATPQAGPSITVSAWAKTTNTSNAQDVISNNDSNSAREGALIINFPSSANLAGAYADPAGFDEQYPTASTNISASTWFYGVNTLDQNVFPMVITTYLNGDHSGNASDTTALTTTATLSIGTDGVGLNEFFDGVIDEVRVSNIARSADWISTEYNNQSAPDTFYTLGAETSLGGAATPQRMLMGVGT